MAPADFLTEKRNEIAARLKELRPVVAEYHRLEAAAAALDGASDPGSRSATPARSPRRSAARGTASTRGGGASQARGRPKGSDTRAAQALALVRASPGITIPEMAGKMGLRQNYLYRVLPGLAESGLVVKDGRGWKPTDSG